MSATTGARRSPDGDADVVVVGAGPAGSTVATYLARAGLDVLVLEKATFPREKVCGDGVTPRGVKQLVDLGVDTREEAGWRHQRGLRVVGGGASVELDWPELAHYPAYGLVRPRRDFDQMLADHARAAGARVEEGVSVTGATRDERTGRVTGVEARRGPERTPVGFRAPLVVACDGVGARTALSLGIAKRDDRPLGVAVRRYYTSPRHDDAYLETHLGLHDRPGVGSDLHGGYGWIFGMGDGTANVGLGVLATQQSDKRDYRAMLRSWLDGLPAAWGLREENAAGPIGGAALPMGLSRTPVYRDGLVLVGDAGGMVNPFSGEGIAYALQSAALAAECVVQAMARPEGPSRERALGAYPTAVRRELGGYYRIGNRAAGALGRPRFMHHALRLGLPRRRVMGAALRLFAGLTDGRDGDAGDRVLELALRLVPPLSDGPSDPGRRKGESAAA
ncbi:geranylgeranyl reductase family protein [Actinomycetospora lutea]|uniref:geranylgeranyl reductase family protein n=1 Tax=Actinomycetospora lutea TaxID=663604 RepID=UPI0023669C7B|nr:geranylgeranyl reductase family protein [Actinomycetospora lutea]MDD7938185.1 geranylgeranyl reductase family protein [Actinomycetospora lutea]